jgi:phosphotransferase system HPr (HPr) family protein
MASSEIVFRDRYGLHPRAAMRIQTTATTFQAAITLEPMAGGAPVDTRSMLALVSTGIRFGDRVRIDAEGPDAEAAVAALGDLIRGGVCHP